ncbi:MAG: type II toxin-antitoxin system VapC family toxin [Gemmataceae bacterium]|nr:type II toxin-antitoxin system VapC family toxin [Gemmataceae bacterium]
MNLLLDTCTFIRLATDSSQVPARIAGLIRDPANTRFLSTASVWEIVVKLQTPKGATSLPPAIVTGDLARLVADQVRVNKLVVIGVGLDHVLSGRGLPMLHRDPFDRLLVSQALADGLTILTPDPLIQQYPVPTEW